MIKISHKLKIARGLTAVYLLVFAAELLMPLGAYALTSGPSQPEVQSFEPAGTTDMVNTFSGSFTYNIPLFELPGPNGGYPFNLAYHSGAGMDEEASWVGLGWSLNPGVVNRNMQALPDDFKGDKIKTELDIKDNWTVSTGFNMQLPEMWSFDLDKAISQSAGSISVGMNMRYNSYQGFGCSHSIGLDIKGKNGSGSITGGAGLGISMDSDDGAGLNINSSLGGKTDKNASGNLSGSIGLGISSRTGLRNLSLGLNYSEKKTSDFIGKTKDNLYALMTGKHTRNIISGSGDVSFSSTRFSPQVNMAMKGFDLSLAFKLGGDAAGAFGYVSFSAAFSMEQLRYKSKESSAYGYIYLQEANGKEYDETGTLLDMSREKDGMVTRNTPNLSAPHLAYDAYSVVGQGMMTQFRPYRNDIGAMYGEYTRTVSTGGGIGAEFGGGYPFHVGINGDIHHSESWSGKWKEKNEYNRDFMVNSDNDPFENVYYRSTGEPTAEDPNRMSDMIGGDEAIKLDLAGNRDNPKLTNNFSNNAGTNVAVETNLLRRAKLRKPRANPVGPITNEDMIGLKEFDISYYPASVLSSTSSLPYKTSRTALDRSNRAGYAGDQPIGHHIGGITATNADGMRYVYGIPAYNKKHAESTFSINHAPFCDQEVNLSYSSNGKIDYKKNGTDKYRIHTQMPPYAHSYLLTSILGPDYIDVDGNGPSENDFGYWVKFNYVKASDGYKWRAPFLSGKASHHTGYESDHYDDKASYMYGEKEIWYLATAETKTHIATFVMSTRKDGQSAFAEFGTTGGQEASYKLDKVELYLKKDYDGASPKPIQTTFFEYDYSLCGNVPNNTGAPEHIGGVNINDSKGKLTLKKVYFKHENSTKGALSPYRFDYGTIGGTIFNPNYDPTAYDRWGQYRQVANECDKTVSPYVDQSLGKVDRDKYATAWNLTTVHMPSGADINISYESHDYAYVQDKKAMQMYAITSMFDPNNPTVIYNKSSWPTSECKNRVYFKLADPLPRSATANNNSKLEQYFDGTGQIYYKLHAYMRKGDDDTYKEYIGGYADINKIGIDTNCIDPEEVGFYRWGYVELKKIKVNNVEKDYHPFTFYILQSLKANLPHFAFRDGGLVQEQAPNGGEAVLEVIKAMGSAFASIKELFTGYYKEKTNPNHQWASRLVIGESFIRLNNVTGQKFGGGSRVKSIAIADNWNTASGDASSSYGQYYSYTTTDNKGNTTSSGVATYEPAIGGEENALRYAKNYPQKISIMSQNNLFYEYPINETLYPSPSVGYSKVTVTSLNTKKILDGETGYGYGSTGITENEFYTAKDFPVVTSETDLFAEKDSKSMKYLRLPIPLPGFGTLNWDIMAASQGYVIQLNDMHGKPKRVASYGLDGTGRKTAQAISSVEYKYFEEVKEYKKPGRNELIKYHVLKSEVPVLITDPDPSDLTKARIETMQVGVDYELLTDQRQSMSWSAGGGLSFNIELSIPVVCPFPWPNINYNENDLRMAVTNKIIHRTGILKEVIATDGQSVVRTENICFDRYTGAPILTTVTNNFDSKVWSYNLPAYTQYDGMGTAYKNQGMRINLPCANITGTGIDSVYDINDFEACRHMVPGDEFVMAGGDKAIVLTCSSDAARILITGGTELATGTGCSASNVSYDMYLVRSGRRNQLNTDAGKIVALKNPTKEREIDNCLQKTYIPRNYEDNCDLGTYGTGTVPYGLLSIADSVGAAEGSPDNWFLPFSHPMFASLPASLLSRAIALGYVGISKEGNIISIINMSGNSCSWALYDKCDLNPQSVFNPYMPVGIDSSGVDCGEGMANIPAMLDGYTLVGVNARHYLYQKPYNCLCTDVFPPSLLYDSTEVQDTVVILDSVINATAVTYANLWSKNFKDARFVDDVNSLAPTYLRGMDASLNGRGGIWRNWMNFVYHTDRRQSTTLVKTSVDGTYKMGMFNWQNPIAIHCDSNWVRANEVTRYDAYNHDVENMDALGIYSAALYSFKGKLPVAVGVNTKYREFGFESFEEYDVATTYHQFNNATSNLDILTHTRTVTVVDDHCQTVYKSLPGFGAIMMPGSFFVTSKQDDIPAGATFTGGEVQQFAGHTNSGGSSMTSALISSLTITHTGILDNKSYFRISPAINPLGTSSWVFHGLLRLPECNTVAGSVSVADNPIVGTEISDAKAHTGRRSVKITGNPIFKQYQLQLDNNKSYTFSAWVSRDDENLSTYKQTNSIASDNCSIEIVTLDASGNVSSVLGRFEPSGTMVAGWQKVEGEFMVTSPLTKSVAIRVYSGKAGSSNIAVYLDDVRIFPTDGNMKSYVYNNRNYRLAATLDDNNYATFYYYDDEGTLYITKQETEKGIYTIQETKANMPR